MTVHSYNGIRVYNCNVCDVEFQLVDPDRSLSYYGWSNIGWKHFCPNHQNYKFGYLQPETAPMSLPHDLINHPPHYTSHPSGVECIQITEHMDFLLGNVVKYIWRNGLKDQIPSLVDLKKAQWYLNRKIEDLEKE